MKESDVRFTGSVPLNYDRYLVPLLFKPYADELAARAARLQPRRVLETAAGTGVVTEALARALPEAEIVATDLNQAMLDVAAGRVSSHNVAFREADALELPFENSSFDLVASQFGIMFFPDKVQANAEARRVLRNGGRYLVAIWDDLERNLLCNLAHEVMAQLFPDNPPMFMERGPFSYDDPHLVRRDLAPGSERSKSKSSNSRAAALRHAKPPSAFATVRRCASNWKNTAKTRSAGLWMPSSKPVAPMKARTVLKRRCPPWL